MDPSYTQAMIQALMGQSAIANPMVTGQNAGTSYGQGMLTGNMMMPSGAAFSNQAAANTMAGGAAQGAAGQMGLNSSTSLNASPSTQLQQPYSQMS